MLHLVGLISSHFAHDARSQEPKIEGYFKICSNKYLIIPTGLAAAPINLATLSMTNITILTLFGSYHTVSTGPRLSVGIFRNTICFFTEELLAPRPTPKLEKHPMSAVHYCLFNIFAATVHIGGRFSIRNLRMSHVVVRETRLSWTQG